MLAKETKVGRPSNKDRAKQGHINTYDFGFKTDMTAILTMPDGLNNFLAEKGFVLESDNLEGRTIVQRRKEVPAENTKRVGVVWFRYSHPQIAKISGSEWSVGLLVKTSLVLNPSLEVSFVVFHKMLEYAIDLSAGFNVKIKASSRNKRGVTEALAELFKKFQDLQLLMVRFDKMVKPTRENIRNLIEVMGRVRLTAPFAKYKFEEIQSIDFSALDLAIDKFPKVGRMLDLMGYYNHYILSGDIHTTDKDGNGVPVRIKYSFNTTYDKMVTEDLEQEAIKKLKGLEQFREFLSSKYRVNELKVTDDHIAAFKGYLTHTGKNTTKTVNRKLAVVSSYYAGLLEKGVITKNPCEFVCNESAGRINNDRRILDLQKRLSDEMYRFLVSNTTR